MRRYLSLGAGVQSSTLALMFAKGELPDPPEAAVFADTQAEPASVYRWLDWLEKQLPFPVHRVTAGNLGEDALVPRISGKSGRTYFAPSLPVFVDGPQGPGVMHRQCTRHHKVDVIRSFVRRAANVPRGCKTPRVVMYIGISLDEWTRAKDSPIPWITNAHPLLDARIGRADCLVWMRDNGFPTPPRSACFFCPYHSPAEWARMKREGPEEFRRAVDYERRMNAVMLGAKNRATDFTRAYLCSQMKPLDEADFRSDVDAGQGLLWDSECEGMCGV